VLGLAGGLSTLTMRPLGAEDKPSAKRVESEESDEPATPRAVVSETVTVVGPEPAGPDVEVDDSPQSTEMVVTLQATADLTRRTGGRRFYRSLQSGAGSVLHHLDGSPYGTCSCAHSPISSTALTSEYRWRNCAAGGLRL